MGADLGFFDSICIGCHKVKKIDRGIGFLFFGMPTLPGLAGENHHFFLAGRLVGGCQGGAFHIPRPRAARTPRTPEAEAWEAVLVSGWRAGLFRPAGR